MNTKIIACIDIDSYFVGAEKRIYNFDDEIDVVIAKKVISSLSYSLKRQGIKAGDNIQKAKYISQNLKIIDSDINYYKRLSQEINNYFKKTQDRIEKISIDEWLIDLSMKCKNFKEAKQEAQKIQQEIKKHFKISISIGLSYNRFLAKMASKLNKPFGIEVIGNKIDIEEKIWPLPIEEYVGIGKTKIDFLLNNNINTIGDLATHDDNIFLNKTFLNNQEKIINNSRGIGFSYLNVNRTFSGLSRTKYFHYGSTNNPENIMKYLEYCCNSIIQELKKRNELTNNISIIIHQSKNNNKFEKSGKINFYTNDYIIIFNKIKDLFFKYWNGQKLYLCGIKINKTIKEIEVTKKENIFSVYKNNEIEKIINHVNNIANKKVVKKANEII